MTKICNFDAVMGIHRQILRLSVPAIVTNITIPLLGMVDIVISGHIGDASQIGAIAVGTMMFNMIYWNFSFLRMGTTGITAQFYGAGRDDMVAVTLYRSGGIALAFGVAIAILQVPLSELLLWILSPSPEVRSLAGSYYYICVWGAPALLCTNAIKGWYIGMQNSKFPMIIAISINVVNIAVSLVSVFWLDMGFVGIAVGTLVAQYFGFAMTLALLRRKYRGFIKFPPRGALLGEGIGKFFKVNGDIFVRSLCLLTVTSFFTAAGARSGDLILAVNALIMQLFLMFSYFMDGFAFAGEALVGRYYGAGDMRRLRASVRALFVWGFGVMCVFSAAYGGGLEIILGLITKDSEVVGKALEFRLWCYLIPVAGVSTFIWDGVFVGLTATRRLVASIFIATLAFFAIYYNPFASRGNDLLWISFLSYIFIRGVVLMKSYAGFVKCKC